MISQNDIDTILSHKSTVMDPNGAKIGAAGQVYLDDQTGDPSWVTVKTGLFGTSESFVPLHGASLNGHDVHVGYTKDQAKDAPRIESDGNLSPEEEDSLYRHYGLANAGHNEHDQHDDHTAKNRKGDFLDDHDAIAGTTGVVGTGKSTNEPGFQPGDERIDKSHEKGIVGRDTSGPTTDTAMTRSEEQLTVGTERREAGKARLRKYVVTENVTETVPVQKEQVRVTSEPITDANRPAAMDGPAISEEEHEVVLHEEKAVVDKEAVAVERVRLDKETVTDQQEVTDSVRKEKIEILDDTVTSTADPKKNKH